MKKREIITLLLLIAIILSVCALAACGEKQGEGVFKGIVSGWNTDLDDITLTYSDFVIDDKVALEIGDAVLKSILGDKFNNTSFIVCEIADKNFYIITRIPDTNVPGVDYNIAISKEDGRILKIWMGE